jgi:DNA polymerase III sliding clamp (beta) subunit (PCNA family)
MEVSQRVLISTEETFKLNPTLVSELEILGDQLESNKITFEVGKRILFFKGLSGPFFCVYKQLLPKNQTHRPIQNPNFLIICLNEGIVKQR